MASLIAVVFFDSRRAVLYLTVVLLGVVSIGAFMEWFQRTVLNKTGSVEDLLATPHGSDYQGAHGLEQFSRLVTSRLRSENY